MGAAKAFFNGPAGSAAFAVVYHIGAVAGSFV
jgi:hypothetical protein